MKHDQPTPYSLAASADILTVHAGFPNAATDRPALPLDFNQILIAHQTSTYVFRIEGRSYEDQGVFSGDIAVIDRAFNPRQTDLVVAWEGEEFILLPFKQAQQQEVWGVVTAIIHQYRGGSHAGTH